MNKYKELFIVECREKLDRMENLAVVLEKEPKNREIINEIFRDAHSIKGMASTMGYKNMSSLSHSIENVFHKIRKEELEAAEDIIDAILRSIGKLKGQLNRIIEGNTDEGIGQEVIEELDAISKGDYKAVLEKGKKAAIGSSCAGAAPDPFVKVRARHLDRLIDMVSELMTLRWKLQKSGGCAEYEDLAESVGELERLNRNLSEKVLAMRMMPISMLTGKLPRTVRDMGKDLGKSVELEISGEAIELDKNIIEALEAPVIHLVRNCIDHGIEFPDERREIGKNVNGNVFFKAYREQNRVIVEIGDDGRGIDVERVIEKVLDAGIVGHDELDRMDRDKILLLVCAPGLSTALNVSEISGRGVGMDVVKSAVESMGGTLSIYSQTNMGTTYRIILPLTSAIIRVFKVEVAGVEYGVPVSEIERVAQIEALEHLVDDGVSYYEPGDGSQGRIRMLDLTEILTSKTARDGDASFKAVVVKGYPEDTAFTVENLLGVEEVIVKPLSTALKFIRGISGVTVLPDGKPMFILNIPELV